MRRDVKLLNDVIADSISAGEFSARYNPPAVHALRARFGADEIINSLHSSRHASLGEEKESYRDTACCHTC